MKRVVALFLMVPVAGWAACPVGPERPACIPEVGQFDNARDVQRCADDIALWSKQMRAALMCAPKADKPGLREEVKRVKEDFEDAADGMTASSNKGVPEVPAAPDNSTSGR